MYEGAFDTYQSRSTSPPCRAISAFTLFVNSMTDSSG